MPVLPVVVLNILLGLIYSNLSFAFAFSVSPLNLKRTPLPVRKSIRSGTDLAVIASTATPNDATKVNRGHSDDNLVTTTQPSTSIIEQQQQTPPINSFELLAEQASICLLESDIQRNAIGKPSGTQASSATNWINDAAASSLQQAFESIDLNTAPDRPIDRDEAFTWIRWMKSTPTSMIIDLTRDFRHQVNVTTSEQMLELIGTTRHEFLQRLACRLIVLPSGATLQTSLVEPPASLVYGKLLFGGVTRYRKLGSHPQRKAGERTQIKVAQDLQHEQQPNSNPPWIMYGGPERSYDCVDIGAAAVLELILMPPGTNLANMQETSDMLLSRLVWSPLKMFKCRNDDIINENSDNDASPLSVPAALSGKTRNDAFQSDFRATVGGLQTQIDAIVRRVLDGRIIRPAEENNVNADTTTRALTAASLEAEELAVLGLSPVKGLLLYGPPGCGKTALAREISKALNARQPKIISAPELLEKWVGGSEKLVRALFADAEAELAACQGDVSKSALHVIVIDEIDAVFRKRSSGDDSGESTRASAVNQILSKLDGMDAIPNVLLIGMTNRRELLDDALLRPGRLEVQIEIPLPDKDGRREILKIHFDALRQRGRLSPPLCRAIDGMEGVSKSKRARVRRTLKSLLAGGQPTYDLAHVTHGFSGADIAGLVRCSGSLALSRARKDGSGVEGLLITLEDVKQSLKEVKR